MICEFQDISTSHIDILSTPYKKSIQRQSSILTQTTGISCLDKEIQSFHVINEQSQTIQEKQGVLGIINLESLSHFLSNVESMISNQLIQNISRNSFDSMNHPLWNKEQDQETYICQETLTQKLNLIGENELQDDLVCTDLSWNQTGYVIAASYGQCNHSSWCSHKGYVSAWNLSLKNLDSNDGFFVRETNSCIMCIEFHPKKPDLIACGTFNGELIVWSIYDDKNPIYFKSSKNPKLHSEPIMKLVWIPSSSDKSWSLLTMSMDGHIFKWDMDEKSELPTLSLQIQSGHCPKSLKPRAEKYDIPIGITAASSYNAYQSNETIIGTETGYIFKCDLNKLKPLSNVSKADNPISLAYEPFSGPIICIENSPFCRNLVLVCGSNGCIKIFNTLNVKPWVVLEPSQYGIRNVQWSPCRPSVFGAVTGDGKLNLYDLISAHPSLPIHSLSVTETPNESLDKISFNPKRLDVVATVDCKRRIQIWKIPTFLRECKSTNELHVLQESMQSHL